MYYSYNQCHKINDSNYTFSIITRILFSIILVFLSCFLCNFIGGEFNSAKSYIECISYSIITISILISLKCPIIIYGKDSILFYVLIYLIPTVIQLFLQLLNDIFNSYSDLEVNISIIYIMIAVVIFTIIAKKEC